MKLILLIISLMAATRAFAQEGNFNQLNRLASIEAAFDPQLYPFYHGVASGDPLQDAVVIWTRVTPSVEEKIAVDWFVTSDVTGKNIVKSGKTNTEASKDFTVKVDVQGLYAGTTYFYHFSALGRNSITGRTKTLPLSGNSNLKFAVVSCSNYDEGFFNGYGKLGERNDLDAIIHLGDYIYEYEPGRYGDTALKRNSLPNHEIVEIGDYRKRYSIYRLDKDLMRAHQQHPFITIWDDHESTNDSYKDGAQNHNPENEYTPGKKEGDWETRKNVSKQAYFEWLPIRNNANFSIQRSIKYGDLVELFTIDTRLEERNKQIAQASDPELNNPNRTMLGKLQKTWLLNGLKSSSAKWKIIGNQVMFAPLNIGFAANPPTDRAAVLAAESSLLDIWDGYPVERDALIDSFAVNKINNILILTGDIHASFAYDIPKQPAIYPDTQFNNLPQPSPGYDPATGKGSYAVELVTPSITSDNFDEILGKTSSAGFKYFLNNPVPNLGGVVYNPHMKFVDLDRNGYFILDLKKDSAQADWYFLEDIKKPTHNVAFAGKGVVIRDKENHIRIINNASADKASQDIETPLKPVEVTANLEASYDIAFFSVFPNPAVGNVWINFALNQPELITIEIVDMKGKVVSVISKNESAPAGLLEKMIPLNGLKDGVYTISIKTSQTKVTRKFIIQ